MKNLILLILLLTGTKAFSIDYVAIASGNWSTAATWSPSGTPGSADNVTIGSTFNVTVDANTTCTNVTISTSTATLTTGNRNLIINGTLDNSGTLSITGTGTITLNSTTSTLTNNVGATISVGAGGTLDTKFTITNDGTITITSTGILKISGATSRTIGGVGTATITNVNTSQGGTKTISSGTWSITTLTTGGAGSENVVLGGSTASFTIPTIICNASSGGALTISGTSTHTLSNITVNAGNVLTVSKDIGINNGATYTINGTGDFQNLTNNGTLAIGATTTINSTLTNNVGANINVGTGGTLDTKNTITNDGTITVTSTGILKLSGTVDRSLGGLGTATITNLTTANSGTKTISSGSWTVTSLTTGGSGNLIFDGLTLSVTTLTHAGTGNITFKNNASVFNVGTLLHNGTGSSKISFNDVNYSLSLSNFTMNTVSSNGCDMTKDVVVSGTLTLTQGNIFLGSGAQLTANTIVGGSSASYVVPSPGATSTSSRLKRDVGTSATTFPIGTSSSFTPVTVTFPSTNTFTARVSASFANVLPNPEGGIKLEWTFTNGTTVGGTATLGLTWNAGDIGTSFDAMNAQAYRFNSGAWGAKGGTVSGNSISINTTNFSPWAVFSPAALPVSLSRFSAKEVEGNALLEWATEQEINNRGFDIEKSLDAKYFYKIGTKDGAGTSAQTRVYSFIDDELSDVSYYRLKQMDMDGGFTYSKIAVVVPEAASDELMVSPNPSNNKLKISINGTIQQVNLLNLNGQTVLSNSSKTIDIANLPDGMYLLQVITENGIKTKKVVKQ